MKHRAQDYWGGICEKAARGTVYHIIKALGKRNSSKSNFLLTDEVGEIFASQDQANACVEQFSNAHGLKSIPYDPSTTNDCSNKPITSDKLHCAIQLTKKHHLQRGWYSCMHV